MKTRFFAISFLTALLTLIANPTMSSELVNPMQVAFENDDMTKAQKRLFKITPSDENEVLAKADLFMKFGQAGQAEKLLRSWAARPNASVLLRSSYTRIALANGNIDDHDAVFGGRGILPSDTQRLLRIAEQAKIQKDLDRAITVYRAIIKIDSRNPQAWQSMGDIRRIQKRNKDALINYRRAKKYGAKLDHHDYLWALIGSKNKAASRYFKDNANLLPHSEEVWVSLSNHAKKSGLPDLKSLINKKAGSLFKEPPVVVMTKQSPKPAVPKTEHLAPAPQTDFFKVALANETDGDRQSAALAVTHHFASQPALVKQNLAAGKIFKNAGFLGQARHQFRLVLLSDESSTSEYNQAFKQLASLALAHPFHADFFLTNTHDQNGKLDAESKFLFILISGIMSHQSSLPEISRSTIQKIQSKMSPLARARAKAVSGDLSKASAIIESKGLSKKTTSPESYLLLIESLLEDNKIRKAIKHVDRMMSRYPTSPKTYLAASVLALHQNRLHLAKKYAWAGLAIYPNDPGLRFVLAESSWLSGKPGEALNAVKILLNQSQSSTIVGRSLFISGTSSLSLGLQNAAYSQLKKAYDMVQRGIGLDLLGGIVFNLALIERQRGNYGRALALLDDNSLNQIDANMLRASLLLSLGRSDEAVAISKFETVRSPVAKLNYGIILRKVAKNDESIKTLKKLTLKWPQYGLVYYHLAKSYEKNGAYSEARQAFQKAAEFEPDPHLAKIYREAIKTVPRG
ncbi:MAG: tetratricopeptide repeat protein [Candidatus Lindowbacteria bacterium]|nr:tetratricopeptide repeat protein [Candidatus Lindowbacteria bacterium]